MLGAILIMAAGQSLRPETSYRVRLNQNQLKAQALSCHNGYNGRVLLHPNRKGPPFLAGLSHPKKNLLAGVREVLIGKIPIH